MVKALDKRMATQKAYMVPQDKHKARLVLSVGLVGLQWVMGKFIEVKSKFKPMVHEHMQEQKLVVEMTAEEQVHSKVYRMGLMLSKVSPV
jgi:hypothetical protein